MDEYESQEMVDEFSETAKGVGQAALAAIKAATGDVAGAVKDVVTNPVLIKAVIAILVTVSLLVTCVAMMIGSAITGTVEALVSGFDENWEKSWEQAGINSNGSLLYLYSTGAQLAEDQAAAQTITDFITSLFSLNHTVDGEDATNNRLGDDKSENTTVTADDYKTTLNALKDKESLIGADGALQRRLDMIKGRVKERGNQLMTQAVAQYSLESLGIAVGEYVSNLLDHPLLFNGVGEATTNINTYCFELTDLQALKIYAAYSMQHDCVISDSDMWDLMDYIGWYSTQTSPLEQDEESIYNTEVEGTFVSEIGGVISSGDSTAKVFDLSAPLVPTWTGSCAPQWYYEEIDQLKELNDTYEARKASAESNQKLDSITPEETTAATVPTEGTVPVEDNSEQTPLVYFETDANGDIILDNFKKLSETETFGLIDKMFTATRATLTVSRSEYHSADEEWREALASAWGNNIRRLWDEAYGAQSKTLANGTVVKRDSDGKHSATITNTSAGRYYYLQTSSGAKTQEIQCTETGQAITFHNLAADTKYTIYQKTTVESPSGNGGGSNGDGNTGGSNPPTPSQPNRPGGATPTNFTSDTQYYGKVYLGCGVYALEPVTINGPQTSLLATTYEAASLGSFRTYQAAQGYECYEINLRMDINFEARSIDSLLYDLLGLWPGSLTQTIEDNGVLYAQEYTGNENLVYSWTDTYTDSEGNTHTLNFQRQQGYQAESYNSICKALASESVLNLGGFFGSYNGGYSWGWHKPCEYRRVSSKFGWRIHPTTGKYSFHNGVDLPNSMGTEIYAARSGTVTSVRWNKWYGNMIEMDHGDGFATLYGHFTSTVVNIGDYVAGGQLIGYMGSTGASTGPHLHFTIYENGVAVDPMTYISDEALAKQSRTVSMMPVGADGYKNMTTSQALIDMIKVMEGFIPRATWDYAQYSVGYGSRASSSTQVVTPAQAEVMLRNEVVNFEKAVNNFCQSIGKQPSQNQFDALVCFSYNLGTGWTKGGTLVNCLAGTVSDLELVNAMGQYCHAGGEVLYALAMRRLREAILFIYGEYSLSSNPAPAANYNIQSNIPVVSNAALPYYRCVVFQYDYSTEKVAKGDGHEVRFYPAGSTYSALPTPTRSGYKFAGWKVTRINNNRTGIGESITASSQVKDHLELTAQWTS